MKIATITPTRGDRPQFFEFARVQLDRQTVQPDNRYYMAYKPDNGVPDLIQRVRRGIELARKDKMDAVFIIEDDDCYPSNYIEEMRKHFRDGDFIGYDDTLYYNVKNRTWLHQTHPKRSSLFCTAFLLSSVEDFIWPSDTRRRKSDFSAIASPMILFHLSGQSVSSDTTIKMSDLQHDLFLS